MRTVTVHQMDGTTTEEQMPEENNWYLYDDGRIRAEIHHFVNWNITVSVDGVPVEFTGTYKATERLLRDAKRAAAEVITSLR
jgi:hypothetical protein